MKKLLAKMLEFNPRNRKTADELLKSKIFDPIRNSDIDSLVFKKKLELSVDFKK